MRKAKATADNGMATAAFAARPIRAGQFPPRRWSIVGDTWLPDKRVLSAVVGSYPKPAYLYGGTGRQLLDDMGMSFQALEEEVGFDEYRSRIRKATLQAITDQNEAGIDLVSDGE